MTSDQGSKIDSVRRVSAGKGGPLRGAARNAANWLQHRRLGRTLDALIAGKKSNLDDIGTFLASRVEPRHHPMVLISQAQRSGGSLLNQLFDGHPELAAYPQELRFGFEYDDVWPPLDPGLGAARNFRMLFDLKFARLMRGGYMKGGTKRVSQDQKNLVDRDPELHQFFLVPRVQYLVFTALWERDAPQTARRIMDHFLTSLFSAWLDYQGQFGDKKWVTAFAPRFAHAAENVARFFEMYPDGRLIQIVRDPQTWCASAQWHRKSFVEGAGREDLVETWAASAQSMLDNTSRYGNRVLIVTFEDLVGRTEETMRWLAREFGIAYDSALLRPSFNGRPMRANSSFSGDQSGVIQSPLGRAALLSNDDKGVITARCQELHQQVLRHAAVVGGRASEISA